MNKMLWVFHVLLSLALGIFGLQKVVMALPDLIAQGMWWIEDFTTLQVRTIGVLEVLAVAGLNLPYFIKQLPKMMVPASTAFVAVTMVGAFITHFVRQDPVPSMVVTAMLCAMAVTLTVKRFEQFREPVVSGAGIAG